MQCTHALDGYFVYFETYSLSIGQKLAGIDTILSNLGLHLCCIAELGSMVFDDCLM
jgi:hypothetical protein